jgi:hypothetical protein
MDAGRFFGKLATLMGSNPPLADDTTPAGGIVGLLAKIGLVALASPPSKITRSLRIPTAH